MTIPKAYLEHVAIWVRDIHWHIKFFHDVFGMTMRKVEGTPEKPLQYWTHGGMQFVAKAELNDCEGRLDHLGIMCEDLEATLSAARCFGVVEMPQGRHWLQLPDGLSIELIQANPGAVAQALAINPHA